MNINANTIKTKNEIYEIIDGKINKHIKITNIFKKESFLIGSVLYSNVNDDYKNYKIFFETLEKSYYYKNEAKSICPEHFL